MRYLLLFLAAAQAAIPGGTMGKAKGSMAGKSTKSVAPMAQTMAGRLPAGTGPIPASRFVGVDWKSATPPAFLSEFRMPALPPTSVSSLMMAKPTTPNAMPSEAAIGEVASAIESEIRSSGVVKPLASQGKKYDEERLSQILTAGLKYALDPASAGKPSRGSGPAVGMAAPPARGATGLAAPGGRRLLGWWDDLWDAVTDFVEDVGCGAFAVGALPGYLLAYTLFHTNTGYQKLSHQQKYFQRAAFTSELLAVVNVKYSAWFPPGFGSAAATTMGSEIYVRNPAFVNDTLPTWNLTLSSNFFSQTRLLMHEMGHTKQYQARSWNVASFGYDYLFRFCEAGMSYEKNSMEKDAETYRDNSDKIMTGLAAAHFKKWKKDDLYWATGYSKSPVEYNAGFSVNGKSILSLDLTKGAGSPKVAESQRQSGTACVRVLWGTALNSRTQATIAGKPWDCVTVKPTKAPTRKPTTRAPTSKKPTAPPTFITVSMPDVPLGLAPTRLPTVRVPTFPPTFKIPA